ncbi:MAG TPA: hypothetical protein VF018_00210 [Acidobacteriaceae bacterium]
MECRSRPTIRGRSSPETETAPQTKKEARFFTLGSGRIIAASEGEGRVFYWLAAETGLRGGELAGLKLIDIDGERLTVNRSVWLGKEQSPETNNAIRTLALSPQLVTLLWEQIIRQKANGHIHLFTSSSGSPRDMNVYRKRKMAPLLTSVKIPQAGFQPSGTSTWRFRMPSVFHTEDDPGAARTRAKGSFTLDVYGDGLSGNGT